MRQFVLINANGNTFDLTKTSSFLHEPEGLGFEYKAKYTNLMNVFVEQSKELKQPEVKGTVKFDDYAGYYEFARFISHTPLTLMYKAYKEFYLDCFVEKIEKSEYCDIGLDCDIKITGYGPFYKKEVKENNSLATGKVYDYTYPYVYADSDTGTVQFDVDTEMQSGVIINIFGPCINPSWSQFVNGVKRASGKINTTIPDGERLVVNTTKIPFSITRQDIYCNTLENMYDKSDFTTERFILLESGQNIISCYHEGTDPVNVVVEGHIYYDTV